MSTPTAAELRAAFDSAREFTVGLEEELFVCAPDGAYLEDAPVPDGAKPEMPAGQVELVTEPCPTADAAVDALARLRARLLATGGTFIAAGTHPTAPQLVALRDEERYRQVLHDYGDVARRQLVASLQVHVAVPGAERALATYNALRLRLPELLALAASAPFHAGRDSGLATVRPTICTLLPRQGVAPQLASWEELARAYAAIRFPGSWWWELRPHPRFGTLEVRVCDSQPTLEAARRVATAVEHVVREAAAGGEPPAVADWQIAENRWSAVRHGLEGSMTCLRTGRSRPTREALRELGVEPPETGWPERLREVAVADAPRWLAERFAQPA